MHSAIKMERNYSTIAGSYAIDFFLRVAARAGEGAGAAAVAAFLELDGAAAAGLAEPPVAAGVLLFRYLKSVTHDEMAAIKSTSVVISTRRSSSRNEKG